jgi:hypothetical protein
MKDKYYTTSIEEFHVGFECERNNISENDFHKGGELWEYHLLSKEDLIQIGVYDEDRIKGRYRVKYLCKEDIESLGFNQYHLEGFTNQYSKNIWEGKVWIKYWDSDNMCEISYEGEPLRKALFRGTIKNKSELIKLLKQLNIQ